MWWRPPSPRTERDNLCSRQAAGVLRLWSTSSQSLTPRERVRAVADLIGARVGAMRRSPCLNFEEFTATRVGYFLYDRFYRPYAVKLYGLPPTQIGLEPAFTRVRRFAAAAIGRDLIRHIRKSRNHYRYPRQGIGQIARELNRRLLDRGGEVVHTSAVQVCAPEQARRIETVAFKTHDGQQRTIPVDVLISTIPMRALLEMLHPDAPAPEIRWRDLRIVYLLCSGQHKGPHETYYCPDPEIIFGRVSDLNKYHVRN